MKSFPLQDRPSLYFKPHRYRPHGIGYWSGHIPFACDLVFTLRPSVFVELGTHTGESFFAFCQAIEESEVSCLAVAVDTWKGDEHTGTYGDEVFQEVNSYTNERYASFATLLRMRFDEARQHFKDGQIDLLHIDGMHTYEAVKHDFETWLPKVRAGGVVVMHDSFGRHDGFGVWKLLEELRTQFPVSEFFHSHGLGVVVKPGGPSADHVANALVHADEETLGRLRRYYQVCAGNLEHEFQADRQRRPAEWDVTSQLFWREANAEFTEAASTRVAHIVGAEVSEAILQLPPASSQYAEFRVDLTLGFALLELRAIRVLDDEGQELCRWAIPGSLSTLQSGGLQALLTDDENGALILDTPIGSQVRLPIPEASRRRLRKGGTFVIHMKGFDTNGFTQRMSAAYNASELQHIEAEERLAKALRSAQGSVAGHSERVDELERSFLSRMTRRRT